MIGNTVECIFCKIINKEISSVIIDEDKDVLVIKDLHPKAPIHYLILPKIHIATIADFQDCPEHNHVLNKMFVMVKKLALNLPEPKAFNLISNNGAEAGQTIFHMHCHFLSGFKL